MECPRFSKYFAAATVALSLAACVGTDVIPGPFLPPTLVLDSTQAAVMIDETVSFNATFTNDEGEVVQTGPYRWRSSDESVATVADDGTARGVSPGQTMITVSLMNTSGDMMLLESVALLNVVADRSGVALVGIEPSAGDLMVDDTLQFTAQPKGLDGADLDGLTVTWTTSDAAVLTIDSTGLATAVSTGSATVTAMVDGLGSTPVTVRVMAPESGRTGHFTGLGSYDVQGGVTIAMTPQGGLAITLDSDFSSASGPALEVYLSHGRGNGPGAISLGPLQRTRGEQTYSVPDDVSLTDFDFVLIHCVPFNVTFGVAELE